MSVMTKQLTDLLVDALDRLLIVDVRFEGRAKIARLERRKEAPSQVWLWLSLRQRASYVVVPWRPTVRRSRQSQLDHCLSRS